MDTKEFFSEIYKGCAEGYTTLTLLPERRTLWFRLGELDKLEQAIKKYSNKTNIYFGVCLRKRILPNNLRGKDNDISTVTTLYADIDIKSKAHAQTALPSSVKEAADFLNLLPLKPTIIVSSGNGLHAYWLLDTPFKIQSAKDQEYISSVFKGWGKVLSLKANEHGWKLDNVSDLARVLRVPGSINHKLKNGAICEVLGNNGTRYQLAEFEPYVGSSEINNERVQKSKPQKGDAQRILEKCDFIQYCKGNAENLPEPYWHAMITNLVPTKDGIKAIHELSKPYPKYDKSETDRKIKHAVKENKPHTCKYIHEHLGFECSKDCNVKSPVVFGTPNKEQRFMDLLECTSIDADKIFSKENMKLCAFAKVNMPVEYAKFKTKLKGKVNLRDFEKAVRFESKPRHKDSGEKNKRLDLEQIELSGCVQPPGWDVSMSYGVRKILQSAASEELISVCSCPLIISRRFENIDDGSQKIEIKFYRDGHWKSITASRSHIFNRNSVIKYADSGLPVSSGNASDIVKYLSDYENTNEKHIPLVKSISRMGWVRGCTGKVVTKDLYGKEVKLFANEVYRNKLEFFPYHVQDSIAFESEYKEATNIIESTNECGSFDIWKENAKLLRTNQFGRFLLAASFASPLLEILQHRVFFVHIWHDSKSGKTAAIKMAISVWGNPAKLMGSFNATSVGLERMAGILKHLPFVIDELQVLNNRRLSVENIIYSLGNGFGRIRGAKEGSIQETISWRNNIITSGEQPMSKESSNDGVLTRVLELYGKPTENEKMAHEFHLVSESNYGFAGRVFIKYLINDVLKTKGKVEQDFENLRKSISNKYIENYDNSHLDNVAIVCLGDYYSSMCVFGKGRETAWNEAIILGTKILENCKELQKADTIDRAWDFVTGWIASNKNRFLPDSTPCYGKIEQDTVYIIPNILRQALEENGFDYSKVTRGFKDRRLIECKKDNSGINRTQIQKKINGINQRCFCIRMVTNEDKVNETNPLI